MENSIRIENLNNYVEIEVYTPGIPNRTLRESVSSAMFDTGTIKYGKKTGVYIQFRNISSRFAEFEYDNEKDVTIPVSKELRKRMEKGREPEEGRKDVPSVSQPHPNISEITR